MSKEHLMQKLAEYKVKVCISLSAFNLLCTGKVLCAFPQSCASSTTEHGEIQFNTWTYFVFQAQERHKKLELELAELKNKVMQRLFLFIITRVCCKLQLLLMLWSVAGIRYTRNKINAENGIKNNSVDITSACPFVVYDENKFFKKAKWGISREFSKGKKHIEWL